MNSRVKILIIRRSALGDAIHTIPLAAALRRKFAFARIDWFVEDKASAFVLNNPLIDNVYVLNKKTKKGFEYIKEFCSVLSEIRKQRYDIVIDTQQLLKSAVPAWLSGAKRRITLSGGREFSGIFSNEIIKAEKEQFDVNYHVVKRNLEIAEYFGCDVSKTEFELPPTTPETISRVDNFLKNIDKNKKTLVIAPETTWDNKHFPVELWQSLINKYISKVNIIYTGTSDSSGLSGKIIDRSEYNSLINLSGKLSLEELREVFSRSDVLVSPDSGSAHVAWADGHCAIVTLFAATSGARTAPFGEKYFYIQSSEDCSPCMKKQCTRTSDKNKCINGINLQSIVNITDKLLQFE